MGRGTLSVPHTKGRVMESIMNTVENVEPKNKDNKTKNQIDSVTLNKNESDKINNWLGQIKESSRGFLDLNRSDLVNYLIKNHNAELTAKEINNIRLAHYSLIKHLNWITPQLKKALDEKNTDLVVTLQAELRGLEIGGIKNAESKNNSPEASSIKTTKKQRVKNASINAGEHKNENTTP